MGGHSSIVKHEYLHCPCCQCDPRNFFVFLKVFYALFLLFI